MEFLERLVEREEVSIEVSAEFAEILQDVERKLHIPALTAKKTRKTQAPVNRRITGF